MRVTCDLIGSRMMGRAGDWNMGQILQCKPDSDDREQGGGSNRQRQGGRNVCSEFREHRGTLTEGEIFI